MDKQNLPAELPPRALKWLGDRRADAERKLEDVCQHAIWRVRTVVADEIRGLSRRVEKMHSVLDQLEQMVEQQEEEGEQDNGPSDQR